MGTLSSPQNNQPVNQPVPRVTYHRLTSDARDTIRWSGVSIADYVRHHSPDGQWRGDRCGCTDDRCISYHHDERAVCGCLSVLLDNVVAARRESVR